MPLRVRLSIAFVAIVLVPLTVTAFLVRNNVSSSYDARTMAQLESTQDSSALAVQQLSERAMAVANNFAQRHEPANPRRELGPALMADDFAAVRDLTRRFGQGKLADFVVVLDERGRVVASHVERGSFLPGFRAPTPEEIAARDGERVVDGPTVRRRLKLATAGDDRVVGTVIAGYWLDADVLKSLKGGSKIELTMVAGSTAVASTLDGAQASDLAARATDASPYGGYRHMHVPLAPGGPVLLSSVSTAAGEGMTARTTRSIAAVVVVSLVMAGLFGWLLARVTTRPLAELGDAALNVANGRLDTKIDVRSRDEVGRLALAFNTMTDELRTYIQALQDSRDELKRNLTRLGDTLSSTHDLKKMLAVILETAMVTIRAEAGALMLFSGNRDELYLKVGRGLDGRLSTTSVRVQVGDGVAGRVAETGEAVHGHVGVGKDQLRLAPSEPRADSVVSVPLKSQGRVIGVLNLYDRVDADEFDDNDLATIRSFANQATVAIDNVLLHQEAQRLSITDGLTGLWNYRYFQMQFDKEIERASRFSRPLALLVLDLDKFKSVNDEYGHQRGDSVLIELATRVKGAIRDVDILARYGGEEFVLILPETDLDGAVQAAGKICELVRHRRFGTADEVPIRITLSIGVAVYPDHGRSGASLLKSADAALYAAKEAGRDGYWIATPMPAIPGEDEVVAAPRQQATETRAIAELSDVVGSEADLGPGGDATRPAGAETAEAAAIDATASDAAESDADADVDADESDADTSAQVADAADDPEAAGAGEADAAVTDAAVAADGPAAEPDGPADVAPPVDTGADPATDAAPEAAGPDVLAEELAPVAVAVAARPAVSGRAATPQARHPQRNAAHRTRRRAAARRRRSR